MYPCLHDAKSIHAVTLLYHLMPDTKTATNHNKIVCIVPVSYVLYIYM